VRYHSVVLNLFRLILTTLSVHLKNASPKRFRLPHSLPGVLYFRQTDERSE